MQEVLRYAKGDEGLEIIQQLLQKGMNPNDQDNGGSSILQSLFNHLGWSFGIHSWEARQDGFVVTYWSMSCCKVTPFGAGTWTGLSTCFPSETTNVRRSAPGGISSK